MWRYGNSLTTTTTTPPPPPPALLLLQLLNSRVGEDRCTQFRVIVVTDIARPPARPAATDRTDYNTLRRYA